VQSEVPVGTYSTSSQVPALITQAEALARLVQEAISPIERERDRLLQVTIDQAERLVRLEAELEQAQERIRALEAPREPSTAQIALGAPTDGLVVEPPTAPAQPQRPWWRFW
jgi:hypothetical protein